MERSRETGVKYILYRKQRWIDFSQVLFPKTRAFAVKVRVLVVCLGIKPCILKMRGKTRIYFVPR